MKGKQVTVIILICFIFMTLLLLLKIDSKVYYKSNDIYQVYLNGDTIGYISDDNELYDLINNEQQQIKDEYNVDSVYPPSSFDIVKINTYDTNLSDVNNIYKKIEEEDNFTVKGYIISIKGEEETITINVLDKEIFEKALKKFVNAFITEEEYQTYLNGTEKAENESDFIESMYFNETITIKEGYISVKNEIYTDVDELTQYLLFGKNAQINSYKVQLGDTIADIAEKYELNTQEFLIANPTYRDADTLLVVGSSVNVTLVNPILTFVCDKQKIEDVESIFLETTIVDDTKPSDYKEITQAGVTGITRLTEKYQVINGETSSEVITINKQILREKVDQITTIGKKTYYASSGTYTNMGINWGWPTAYPYVITSRYGTRNQTEYHRGIDISGTGGLNSPIYAAADGVVVESYNAVSRGSNMWQNGTYIVISHGYEYYTVYCHLNVRYVEVGDVVKKGQLIGGMGETGRAFGVHLHFGFFVRNNGTTSYLNPLTTIYK